MTSNECIVKGTLAKMLIVGRIFGMAPLRFEKLRDGYKATVSFKYAIYGYILVTLLNATAVIAISLDVQKRAVKTKSLSNLAFVLPDLATACISSGFGGYYGFHRMRNLIMYINGLDKATTYNINDKSFMKKMKNRENMNLAIVISYIVSTVTFYIMQVYNLIDNYGTETLLIVNYSVNTIIYINMNLLEIQIILMLIKIQRTLESINNTLDKMVSVDYVGNQYTRFLERKNIHRVSLTYVTVCDIISKMNRTDGCVVLIIFTNFVITIITSLYYGFVLIYELPLRNIILQHVWCILYTLMIITFIEVCNNISSEVTNINVNLILLIEKMTNVGERIPWELELTFKQLVLNKPEYSPMEVFTPQRNIIITISNAILTYVIFMVQLKL